MANPKYTYEAHPDDAFVYDIFDENGNKVDAPPAGDEIRTFFDQPDQKRHDRARSFRRSTRILVEGDSWANWSVLDLLGFPDTFADVLEKTYSVLNLGFPGHRFDRILADKDYISALSAGTIDYFIFSGGGNDILGGGVFEQALKDRSHLGADPSAADCLNDAVVEPQLDKLEAGYLQIARETEAIDANIRFLIHGYDYAIPQPGGRAIGQRLANKNYNPQSALSREIVRELVNRFYGRLENVASGMQNTTVVNLRGAIGSHWFDELHPDDSGAASLADRFAVELPAPEVS